MRGWLVVAVVMAAAGWVEVAAGQVTTIPATRPMACCGQRMMVVGLAHHYVAKLLPVAGAVIEPGYADEIYGKLLLLKAELPAGTYTVEVSGSENSYAKAGARVFDVVVGKEVIARNVDWFALADGVPGKHATVSGKVTHTGGELKVMLTSKIDNAKFNAIYVLDTQGNKVAWALAEDMKDVEREEKIPVVNGGEIWKEEGQPLGARVADLVRRMTLKEKVEQMMYQAPAIERLGVPAYNYWNECLHGVARNGAATVFPQAIGMAASWDPELLHEVGDVISTEARAKHAESVAKGERGNYQGLNFWTPNINLFRDPRWGRGQETYGEDPYLTGRMAVAFIRGLQGDDTQHLKVAATAKHFAVHSGPELLRHVFDAQPPERDFYESYLPQFEAAVREGKVASVMAAYNRVYGEPASGSSLLLEKILRGKWGFKGNVVSDCGAVFDIWANHQVVSNRAEAAALAVKSGTDLECGTDYSGLLAAVDMGLINEQEINVAVGRVLAMRFRLGTFDKDGGKWGKISAKENDTPEHDALALKMARESLVLLKNDGVLPLKKGLKRIVVVGPNGDGLLPLVGNYNGTPTRVTTVLEGIRAASGGANVEYVRGCDVGTRPGAWQVVPDVCFRAAGTGETGLRGEWFANEDLSGTPTVARTDTAIDFNGSLEWIVAHVPHEKGSVRWTGEFVAPADGAYRLVVASPPAGSPQGHRWWVNGQLVDDRWNAETTAGEITAPIMQLKTGQAVPVKLEAHQSTGYLGLLLYWNRMDVDVAKVVAERVNGADVVIFAGGYDGRVEAEEGDVRAVFDGFTGGDRDRIELPQAQGELLRALVATGVPVVYVNMTGSAVAVPWAAENVKAIVQAWYPGQAGGQAVGEVLFGAVNPSGRLPVTFYRSTTDLPAFTNYAMAGRTYRFFEGKTLWGFGHGLSYTAFKYGEVGLSAKEVGAADVVTVSVDVTNAGGRDGAEVVQVYARGGDLARKLVGFKRVEIGLGKTVRVEVPVRVSELRVWDVGGKRYAVGAGEYELAAGSSAEDVRGVVKLVVKN